MLLRVVVLLRLPAATWRRPLLRALRRARCPERERQCKSRSFPHRRPCQPRSRPRPSIRFCRRHRAPLPLASRWYRLASGVGRAVALDRRHERVRLRGIAMVRFEPTDVLTRLRAPLLQREKLLARLCEGLLHLRQPRDKKGAHGRALAHALADGLVA
eukprot:26429-Pleurochrysis_carterae.AAC.3